MPEPPPSPVTTSAFFPEEADDREYQTRSPDDVADPTRKLVSISPIPLDF
jgi:hypothetical protein